VSQSIKEETSPREFPSSDIRACPSLITKLKKVLVVKGSIREYIVLPEGVFRNPFLTVGPDPEYDLLEDLAVKAAAKIP
jgi:hypothetical protein